MKTLFYSACFVVLAAAILFFCVLTRNQRETFLKETRTQWLCLVEPNMLNRILLSRDSDASVVLPSAQDGVVLTKDELNDLHVAVNRDRHVSIHGARLSRDILLAIIEGRLKRFHGTPPRVFLWADQNLSMEEVSEWVRLFHEADCLPVYRVVAAKGPGDGSSVTRKAVLCEPETQGVPSHGSGR